MEEYQRIKENIEIKTNELENRKNKSAICYIINLNEQKRLRNGDIEINITFDYPVENYKTEFDENVALESVFLSDRTFKAKISTYTSFLKVIKYLSSISKQIADVSTTVSALVPASAKPIVDITTIGSNIASVGINGTDSSFNNSDDVNGRILIYTKRKYFEDYNKEKKENEEQLINNENNINKLREEIENLKDN